MTRVSSRVLLWAGVEVEIRVGEGDDAPSAWMTAEVLSVLVDGQFQVGIVLPDGSDKWEDWFSWQEEDVEWRRIPPDPNEPWQRHLRAREGYARPEDVAASYSRLAQSVSCMRKTNGDAEDELDGWHIKYKVRKGGGYKVGDVYIIDPLDGEAYQSMVGVRRKLGLVADKVSGGEGDGGSPRKQAARGGGGMEAGVRVGAVAGTRGATRVDKPPPPPDGWQWPFEGERIDVEVQADESEAAAWVPAEVLVVLVDGQFQARITLADGSDEWDDWFSWQEEGTDWRRPPKPSRRAYVELPPGWSEIDHVAKARRYQTYKGPNGEKAVSRASAWRMHDERFGGGGGAEAVADEPQAAKEEGPPAKKAKKKETKQAEGEAPAEAALPAEGAPSKQGKKRKRAQAEAAEAEQPPPAAASTASADGHVDGAAAKARAKKAKVWPRVPLNGPSLGHDGVALATGVMVEVVLTEEGLAGSRFVADVLELRGRGAKREAHVQYHSLYDDAEDDGGEGGGAEGGAEDGGGDILLREWVSVSSLASPPPPPPPNWQRTLKTGDECDALHEGGWWPATVVSKLPGSAKNKEPPKFVIEATGYGVQRTVGALELRPTAEVAAA